MGEGKMHYIYQILSDYAGEVEEIVRQVRKSASLGDIGVDITWDNLNRLSRTTSNMKNYIEAIKKSGASGDGKEDV